MHLTEFIRLNHDQIIREWVEFASTRLPWARNMSEETKRDQATELLVAVVDDMEAPQSKDEQAKKSHGLAAPGELAQIGHTHATQRAGSGFNLDQLVSEYRALRASVLRLWAEQNGEQSTEVTRFNEAIDESLTEATGRYAELLEHTRDQFLAILSHDLRNPLGTILIGATALVQADDIDDRLARVAARIQRTAERMGRMVNDLLDLTRARLGGGIPVTRRPMDLGLVCQQSVSDLETMHPEGRLCCETSGNLRGEWDPDRITQVVSNLVENALSYGSEHEPVSVIAQEHGDGVLVRVHNWGPPVPEQTLTQIFEPMVRSPDQGRDRHTTGLGLGLYIAREIVHAHGGKIRATSTAQDGTTFTVSLPRAPRDPKSRP